MALIFFPVKAEMLIFWILMTGGPPGDLQSVNLSLKMQILTEDVTTVHVKLHISSKTDLGTPWHYFFSNENWNAIVSDLMTQGLSKVAKV